MKFRSALLILLAALASGMPQSALAEKSALDGETLVAMIEDVVRRRAPGPVSAIEVPPVDAFELAEVGGYDVSISAHPDQKMTGWVPLTLTVSDEGRVLRHGVVTVHVKSDRMAVVAARTLDAGAILTRNDLTSELRPESDLADDWLAQPEPALGKTLRRSLRAGAPLRERHVELGPTVRRGDTVKIVLSSGALRIDAVGRALHDARGGELLRVRSRGSKRPIEGQVDEEGTVHVLQ